MAVSSVLLSYAAFEVYEKSSYQNVMLTIGVDVSEDDYEGLYVVLERKAPNYTGTGSNPQSIYTPFEMQDWNKYREENGVYYYSYVIKGVAEGEFDVNAADGKNSDVTDIPFFALICHSGVDFNVYLINQYKKPLTAICSNKLAVTSPDICLFEENFDSYKGVNSNVVATPGGDSWYLSGDGVYLPIVKNQAVVYDNAPGSFDFSEGSFAINSCLACATSSAFELMNYKTTGSVKCYSAGFVYGASTSADTIDMSNPYGDSDIVDTSGMYYLDAARAVCKGSFVTTSSTPCNGVGCPGTEQMEELRHELGYSFCPNDSLPCVKFHRAYTPQSGYDETIYQLSARELYNRVKSGKPAGTYDAVSQIALLSTSGVALRNRVKAATRDNPGEAVILHFNNAKIIPNDQDHGIVASSPDPGLSVDHAMLVIGWVTIANEFYWMCHNSWGLMGDNGKVYIRGDHENIGGFYLLTGFQKARPANWRWNTLIESGKGSRRYLNLGEANETPALLSAREWTDFCGRINEFRVYQGKSKYEFTPVYSGNSFTAAMYNQARLAIQGISGYGSYIPTVSSGQTITAYMMNILVSELNAIP